MCVNRIKMENTKIIRKNIKNKILYFVLAPNYKLEKHLKGKITIFLGMQLVFENRFS